MERSHLTRSLEEELDITSSDYESSEGDNNYEDDFKTKFMGQQASVYKWAIYNPKPVTNKRWYYVKTAIGAMLDEFIQSGKKYYTKLITAEGGSKQYGFILANLQKEDGTFYDIPLIFEANFNRAKDTSFVPNTDTIKNFWEVKRISRDHGSDELITATLLARFGSLEKVKKNNSRSIETKNSTIATQRNSDETFERKVFGPKLDDLNWIIKYQGIWYFVNTSMREKIKKFVRSKKEHDNNLILCDGNPKSHCLAYVYAYSGTKMVFEKILLLRANFEKTNEGTFEPVKDTITQFFQCERVAHYYDTHAADIFYFIDEKYGGVKSVKKNPFYKKTN